MPIQRTTSNGTVLRLVENDSCQGNKQEDIRKALRDAWKDAQAKQVTDVCVFGLTGKEIRFYHTIESFGELALFRDDIGDLLTDLIHDSR